MSATVGLFFIFLGLLPLGTASIADKSLDRPTSELTAPSGRVEAHRSFSADRDRRKPEQGEELQNGGRLGYRGFLKLGYGSAVAQRRELDLSSAFEYSEALTNIEVATSSRHSANIGIRSPPELA